MANVNKTPGKARRAEVAGGGFAGLTAAIALRQNGWDVRLHEKSSELRAFGAGIYLWHNGLRVLEGLGALDEVLQGSHTPPTYETWMHNKSVSKETFNGLPWRIMTRSHVHDALVNRARALGVDISVNSEAVAADPEGRLTLQTGEVLEADLIVGADGVGSKVRDSIGFKQDRWISKDGLIRLIVPRKKKELGHGEWDNTIDMWNFWPRVQRILYSPCNENELYLGLMAPAADPRGSSVPIDLEVWVEMFPFLEPCLVEAAKLVGLHEAIMRMPQGYDTDIGEGGSALLRAQRQQLGLARAAYGNPAIVVLDDPNSSLDYEGERMLFEAIERMKLRQITTVIITHRMGILPVTNKIAIVRNGTIAAFGDSEKIFESYLQLPARAATGAE